MRLAIAVALCCTALAATGYALFRASAHAQVNGADHAPADAGTLTAAEVAAQLDEFSSELGGARQAYARALAGAVQETLAEMQVTALTPHEMALVLNTIEFHVMGAPPSAEEQAFFVAHTKWATENLLRHPVTEEGTATLNAQLVTLSERLRAVVERLQPEQVANFEARFLEGFTREMGQAAESLLAGGPMHPMSDADLDLMVAEFERLAMEPGPEGRSEQVRLEIAGSTALARLRYSMRRPDEFPADVQAAYDTWRAARDAEREEEHRQDEQAFKALVVRDVIGPYALRMEASSVVCDAVALWHELRAFQQELAGDEALLTRATSQVGVEFWEDDGDLSRFRGTVRWDASRGSQLVLSSERPGGWLVYYWDGARATVSEAGSALALGALHGDTRASATALPDEPPPVVRITSEVFAEATATQILASRMFWSTFLPLLQRPARPQAHGAVDLTRDYAPGVAPLMWNSQPRATAATRDAGAIALLDQESRTIARIRGEDEARVGQTSQYPLTVDLELSPRHVQAIRHVVSQTPEGTREEDWAALVELDVRRISVQLRMTGEGILVLDEYKACRSDNTPVYTVRFGGYELLR